MKTPGNWTIEGLFEGRLEAYRLFNILRAYIESLGPVKIEATKTQVSFGLKTKFAWVWLPQMWIKQRKERSITITFDLPRQIQHPRIKKAVEPRPGRWTHHVVIENESDIDSNIREWLKEAYHVAQQRASSSKGSSSSPNKARLPLTAFKDERIVGLAKKASHRTLATWAIYCTERVLPYFERKYPEDERPRKAIETLQAWMNTGVFKMAVDVRLLLQLILPLVK
jgi:hypothetical protein